MATKNVTIRMDEELKTDAENLFSSLGLNLTTAFQIFLKQAVREQRIPFEITMNSPNTETRRAIKESEDLLRSASTKRYSDMQSLVEDLENEI